MIAMLYRDICTENVIYRDMSTNLWDVVHL